VTRPTFDVRTAASASVKTPALAPSVHSAPGVQAGQLSGALRVVDVPLLGPGSWTLSTNAPLRADLLCPSGQHSVANTIVLIAHELCQLQLSSTNSTVDAAWQLSPVQ
jgi:hypothetical protein